MADLSGGGAGDGEGTSGGGGVDGESGEGPGWAVRRRLGERGPFVTGLGLGCAPLGNLFRAVSDEDATATVDAAYAQGIRYFDTAPLYGHGLSERRLGSALSRYPRDSFVISTKVGRLVLAGGGGDSLRPNDVSGSSAGEDGSGGIFEGVGGRVAFDYSRDGILRSIEASLERLGTDHVEIALVHDPDDHEGEALATAFPTLIELRDSGVVQAVGAGMNQVQMLERFVERVGLDCILVAGRYTLLDQSAGERLLPLCQERKVGVILGGVFNSGVLASPDGMGTFDYAAAPPAVSARVRQLAERYGETAGGGGAGGLAGAALRFAMAHPAATTVVVGARSAAEVTADVAMALGAGRDEFAGGPSSNSL